MIRNKVVIGLIGSGILVVALVVGTLISGGIPAQAAAGGASAAPPGGQKYCELFVRTLAANLHVSVSQLETATQNAARTTVEKAYSDGQITRAKEQRILTRLSKQGADPCTSMGRHMGGPMGTPTAGGPTGLIIDSPPR